MANRVQLQDKVGETLGPVSCKGSESQRKVVTERGWWGPGFVCVQRDYDFL